MTIVANGIKGYNTRLKLSKRLGTIIHRTAKESSGSRRLKKLTGKSSWFKNSLINTFSISSGLYFSSLACEPYLMLVSFVLFLPFIYTGGVSLRAMLSFSGVPCSHSHTHSHLEADQYQCVSFYLFFLASNPMLLQYLCDVICPHSFFRLSNAVLLHLKLSLTHTCHVTTAPDLPIHFMLC